MRQPPGHPSLFDHWDRMASRSRRRTKRLSTSGSTEGAAGSTKARARSGPWTATGVRDPACHPPSAWRPLRYRRRGHLPKRRVAALVEALRRGRGGAGKDSRMGAVCGSLWCPRPKSSPPQTRSLSATRQPEGGYAGRAAQLALRRADGLEPQDDRRRRFDSRERKAERKRRNAALSAEKRHRAGATPAGAV